MLVLVVLAATVVVGGEPAGPHVEKEGPLLKELLPAGWAGVGDPTMLSLMLNKLELAEEPSPAIRADVWLQTSVEPRVHHQVLLPGEGFSTHLT